MSAACPICERQYDKNKCTPLIIPCGHTMCRKCLFKFEGNAKICLLCDKSWVTSSVESLPVCFQLIPGENTKPGRALWCNTCRSSYCMKYPLNENVRCDLIRLDEECLKQVVEYTHLCTNISIKKTNYEKLFNEVAALSKTLMAEILGLSYLENQSKEHIIKQDDSDERTRAILTDNIKHCKESLATKLPVATSHLLSPFLSALQVNCYLPRNYLQSLLHCSIKIKVSVKKC